MSPGLSPDARLLKELRARTRAEHSEIEDLLQLTQPMSLERYAAIVRGFDAFLSRWEPQLAAALPAHLRDWSRQRTRAALAARDLEHVAGDMPQADRATDSAADSAAERALADLPLTDTASALGSMYVIEGSALGGQVITPMLQQHLGLTPEAGASYFHGHGARTGAMWRDFREVITRELGDTETAIDAACTSARRTFTALCSVFKALPA
ncbi:MAG: biliverdin-producing heme oxygenase [Rhizobacter sp.]